MYISFGITRSVCKVELNLFIELVSGTFSDEVFVILSAILLPIKSPIASNVFWIALFEVVFSASVATLVTHDFLGVSRNF